MTRDTERNPATLDDAVSAVRDDAAPAGAAESAAARVWDRIAPSSAATASARSIRGCDDVRALLDVHRRSGLTPARALLVDDHLRDCPRCRAAFAGQRRLSLLPWRPGTTAAEAAARPRRFPRYAMAASVLLMVGLSAWALRRGIVPSGNRAAVQSVTGALQLLAAHKAVALAPGQEVGEAEPVRTARDSRAVLRLRDGSLVEMSERAEIAVTALGADTTIHLARGSIIVRAARRRTGHLRVASGDCNVEVTGTVFSVNRGLKGSRVSVIEGQVRVAGGGGEAVLTPGDQWANSAAVGRVPLQHEIAWSGEADQLLALLGELNVLRERWQQVPRPGLRYESRLLRLLPEETVVFASLPNYGEALGDAHRLFEERLGESATLRGLWAEAAPARRGGPSLAGVIEKIRAVADHLGDEVVLAVVDDRAGRRVVPLVLAEVRRPGLRELLEHGVADAGAGKGPAVRIVGEAANAAAHADVFVLLRPDLVVMAVDEPALAALSARLDAGAGGLDRTPLGERIAQAYGEGAGLIFAADLERITRARTAGEPHEALHRSGLDGLRSFILERKDVADKAHTQAVLSFQGGPRGIPSWLAAPAPMGALDFVSPSAQAVMAFVVKSPALIFDDIVEMTSAGDGAAREHLQELESKLDVRLRADIAETLGGEVALAFDGPLLPTPAWRLIVEVYDPARLQSSLQALVNRVNDEPPAADDRAALRLEAEQVDGETYYALRGSDLPFELHYAYAGGYLVAAPQRALVMKAVLARASGETLARSAGFRGLFPPDRDVNVSGLVYQNLGPMMGSLVTAAGAGGLSAEQRRSLEGLARSSRPTLVSAYGEDGGIRVAGEGPLFDLDASDLALPVLLERVLQGTARRVTP